MFCPKCGIADQQVESFCRGCGSYLPDFEKLKPREISPEEHLKANLILSVMTAVASLGLAVTLYVMFLGKDGTPPVIYLTAGFLTAMFAWQTQVLWRNFKLKKQIVPANRAAAAAEYQKGLDSHSPNGFLNEPNFKDHIQPDAGRRTTNKLKINKST